MGFLDNKQFRSHAIQFAGPDLPDGQHIRHICEQQQFLLVLVVQAHLLVLILWQVQCLTTY